jgi:molybdopterin synthase catalytic subunit
MPRAEPPQVISLTDEAIDLASLQSCVLDACCGAVCSFLGTTREVHEGRSVALLSYEAYRPMAEKAMQSLVADMRARWPELWGVCLVHRLGEVPLAEASVAVVVSAPHRGAAFEACRYGIDELKAQVPIWKKESYQDGQDPRWVENAESRHGETEVSG